MPLHSTVLFPLTTLRLMKEVFMSFLHITLVEGFLV